MTTKKNRDWKPGDPIGYIRPQIPQFELPAYKGKTYEATVPDTLDLQERAKLAIHAMTETTDALADYEPYYVADFRANPARMIHNWWHGTDIPKYQQAVLLARLISGSEQNLEVEKRWMEVALKCQGPDGLIYTPLKGRPWALRGVEHDMQKKDIKVEEDQMLHPFGMGLMLSAMSLFGIRDGAPLWKDAARRLVDGLIKMARDHGDFAYFWPNFFIAAKNPPANAEVPLDAIGVDTARVLPQGMVHSYRLLGYEPALPFAKKIINYIREYFYTKDGKFLRTPGNPEMAHFHAHSSSLLIMQEYAEIVDDQELMEFVVQSFEYAKNLGTNWDRGGGKTFTRTPGSNLVGYFPEFVNSPEWEGSEICEVSDMIGLALRLSEAGIGDYWDDADRWTRNMLVEGQLLSTDWIDRIPEAGLINPTASCLPPSVVGPYDTKERVAERHLGAFAGWPAANDWYVGNGRGIMSCCMNNGARALYWVWERILRYDAGKLKVNLLLNRPSPWADIDSFIPYQGRVDIKIKVPCQLSVRIPEWVTPQETRCQVQGKDRSLTWEGRYAQVGEVKPGDLVTVTFPIEERTDVVHIEKQRFTLVRKGNEVVSIDPPGRFYPFYQRGHYRDSTPRWKKITRFVSNEQIKW